MAAIVEVSVSFTHCIEERLAPLGAAAQERRVLAAVAARSRTEPTARTEATDRTTDPIN